MHVKNGGGLLQANGEEVGSHIHFHDRVAEVDGR